MIVYKLLSISVIFVIFFSSLSCKDEFEKPDKGVVIVQICIPIKYNEDVRQKILDHAKLYFKGSKPLGYSDGKVSYDSNHIKLNLPRMNDLSLSDHIIGLQKWFDAEGYNDAKTNVVLPD